MNRAWLWLCFALLACAGKSEQSDAAGGAGNAGSAGDAGVAGSSALGGHFNPPLSIQDEPESLGPSPVACPGTPVPDPGILKTCLLVAGCSPSLLAAPVSECVAKALPSSTAFSACLRDATSCAEVDACTGFGVYSEPCPKPGGSTCFGNKALFCDSVPSLFVDCAAKGVSCLEYAADSDEGPGAYCGVEACEGKETNWACSGTRRFRCGAITSDAEDCAAKGLDCVETADGAVCRAKTPACSAFGTGSCNADGTGSYCDEDGRTIELDCSPLGFACQAVPQQKHGVACLAPGCAPADAALCFEECDGPLAHLCVGGQRLSLDCRSYGFASCVLENRADIGDRARCGE